MKIGKVYRIFANSEKSQLAVLVKIELCEVVMHCVVYRQLVFKTLDRDAYYGITDSQVGISILETDEIINDVNDLYV